MIRVALLLITIYQRIISPALKQLLGQQSFCRYSPSCSEYAKQVIKKYGIMKGSFLAGRRLFSCQPWFHTKESFHG